MKRFEVLPRQFQNEAVRPYYDALKRNWFSRFIKRAFDIFASLSLIILLSPIMLVIAIWIKLDSKGPVLYKSTRVTTYGRDFKIWKFRTMVVDADKKGARAESNAKYEELFETMFDDTKDSDGTNTHGKDENPEKEKAPSPTKKTPPKQDKPKTVRELLIDKLKEKGIDLNTYATEKGLTKETSEETYKTLLAELEG